MSARPRSRAPVASTSSGERRLRKVLWAPWRVELFSAPKPKGCIFCRLPRSGDRRQNLVLEATATAVVMLNRYPYTSGHLMVAPRRHVADLGALTSAEYIALAERLRGAVAIIDDELRPDGMNVGLNLGAAAGAGIADHLHWHVVPRWTGDTNFMPALGDVRVMPQHLLDTYDRFFPRFAPRQPQKSAR